jgi:hypothetical protein
MTAEELEREAGRLEQMSVAGLERCPERLAGRTEDRGPLVKPAEARRL